MRTLKTKTGRATREEILKDYKNIISNDYFHKLLNSIPNIVAIINSKRQIIFSNNIMIEAVRLLSIEDILGARIGESIDCVYSDKEETGCGTSENCDYCGANIAIRKSQKEKATVTDECRITARSNGYDSNYDFKVTVTPLEWNNQQYSIVSLNDISGDKRRLYLEQIFIHDVVNKISSLNCYLEMIKETKETGINNDFLKGAIELSNDITDDIISQRELIAAESDKLKVEKIYVKTSDIVNVVVNVMKHHVVSKEKLIQIDKNARNETINTDYSLIKRVLINLLKNALEAIGSEQIITIGCDKKGNEIIFWVHNPTFISKENELQIFQRNFSTKSNNRGLGTYSIKLLTEKYLGGKVSFSTNKKNGTIFKVCLPI